MTNVSDFVRDKVSEVELSETWSETWSETRKYSSGLVRSGPVRSGRSSGIWPFSDLCLVIDLFVQSRHVRILSVGPGASTQGGNGARCTMAKIGGDFVMMMFLPITRESIVGFS